MLEDVRFLIPPLVIMYKITTFKLVVYFYISIFIIYLSELHNEFFLAGSAVWFVNYVSR